MWLSMQSIVILVITSLSCAMCQKSLQSQAKQLLSLLAPTPAVGEPWPSIPGPDLKDRVCIIGAGASGIHMATSLKKRKYENVVVFERSIRVGGKCYDVNYRGTPNALGASYLEANAFNEDNIIPFLREYGLDSLVPVSSTHMWATNSASDPGSKLTPSQFTLGTISKLTNSTSPKENLSFFLQTVVRYIKLHIEMFGLYEGDLMQRPTKKVMHRIRGTLFDFLERENVLGMLPIFQVTQTAAGYGHIDEIGALYGLIWHNPRLVLVVALKAIKQDNEPFSLFYLKNGYEHVWKTVAQKEKLNIRFKTEIIGIQRKKSSVYLKTWQNFKPRTEVCDFLIWTPEASELLRTLDKPTNEENRLLGSLKSKVYVAHLANMDGGVRHAPSTAFMANVLSKVENSVTWISDNAGLLTPGIKTPEVLEKYNNETGTRTLYVLHAPSKQYTNEKSLREKTRDHFINGFNVTHLEFLETVSWSYLPRWTPEEVVEGRHWDVFKMQGQNRIWYAGVSASYESVRSVVSYNNRLLKQMIPQSSFKTAFQGSNSQSVFANKKGLPTVANANNCRYSCTAGGGCEVRYVGPPRRGYTLGSCWPKGGACGGTPGECRDCNKVIKC
eukprot:GFUD01112994.1.p1 GENE.GFUD01112994.1~~GFUD01112994.1.p1  ORF type:complete len:612 (-),score=92.37 GFUD01112994.1:186-2021(-)